MTSLAQASLLSAVGFPRTAIVLLEELVGDLEALPALLALECCMLLTDLRLLEGNLLTAVRVLRLLDGHMWWRLRSSGAAAAAPAAAAAAASAAVQPVPEFWGSDLDPTVLPAVYRHALHALQLELLVHLGEPAQQMLSMALLEAR